MFGFVLWGHVFEQHWTIFVVNAAATEVVVDTEPRQDDDGDEMNDRSTFFNVKCASCNTAIGRMYAKTPAGLDNLRNMFSFEVAKCKRYVRKEIFFTIVRQILR